MNVLSNTTREKCSIEPPIVFLQDGKHIILALNIAANMILMPTSILGNLSILLSFVLVPSLPSASNNLLLGLVLTDLGVGLVVHPLYIFVLLNVYNNSLPHCKVMAAYSVTTAYLGGVSLLYVTMIGIDKYLAIKLHLRYREIITEKRLTFAQIGVWVLNGLLSLVWLRGFRVYSAFAAVVVLLSIIVAFAVYVKIYQVVKIHRRQIHIQMESMESSIAQFENCRLKRLRKSAISTLYVFFVFLLCYLPFSLSTAINVLSDSPKKAGILTFELCATLMMSNSCLNPLMYCLRFREFRIAVKKTYRLILCGMKK